MTFYDHPEHAEFNAWATKYVQDNPFDSDLLGGHDGQDYWAFLGWKAAKEQSNSTQSESNYDVFADCNDITAIDNMIDFSKKEQRELYFAIWQLIQAKENLYKAIESLK